MIFLLFSTNIALFVLFCLLLVILYKDNGRFHRLIVRARNYKRGQRSQKNNPEIKDSKCPYALCIAFKFEGGYGDYLICANFLEYFRGKFANKDTYFDLYGSAVLKDIYNYDIPNVKVFPQEEFSFDFSNAKYDVVYKIAKRNQLLFSNDEKVKMLHPSLFEYVLLCKKYLAENRRIFDANPELDCLTTAGSEIKGLKRMQEADIYGYFGITEDFKFNIRIKENEEAYLESLGLEPGRFILVHRGWYAEEKGGVHVKVWSLESCGDIIPRLKEKFPMYKLVLFGEVASQAPDPEGADLNLLEKTTLDQAKVLLKHAAVLVDNEGGMVHLRHALHGGRSVVLFGPTSRAVFGYSENINISSTVCSQWCEWMSGDWRYVCIKTGKRNHPCMDAIKTADIVDAVSNILKREKEKEI